MLEDGQTYQENAARKALAFAQAAGSFRWQMIPAWKWMPWMVYQAYTLPAFHRCLVQRIKTGGRCYFKNCKRRLSHGGRVFDVLWL